MSNEIIKVLLIDDNPGDVKLIQHTLSAQNRLEFLIESGERLNTGIQMLRNKQYHLLLLDLSLPDSQGLETFSRVKPLARDLPIIVLTGLNDEEIAIQAVRKGAQDYIVKDDMNTGLLVRAICYAIERSKAEEKRRWLEMKMLYAQKLESLNVLSEGVARNFSSLMTAIIGNSELAQEKVPEVTPGYANIQKITRSATQAAELINQMLAYAGKGRFIVETLNISKLVEETKPMIETNIPNRILIEYELNHEIPLIKADVPQIQQMIINLITNSVEAIGTQSGNITLRVFGVRADARWLHDSFFTGEIAPGTYTCLQISDTGQGISPENRARIFDPFFTTKFTSRGLGLAAVHGIIRGHNGAVRVTSQVGKGTKIVILLPAIKKRLQPASEEVPCYETAKQSPTIIMVEELEELSQIAKIRLEQAGFNVLMVDTNKHALQILQRKEKNVQMAIVDLPRPEEGILDTLTLFREHVPHLKLIITSGYDENNCPIDQTLLPIDGMVKKPYRFEVLIEKINELTK